MPRLHDCAGDGEGEVGASVEEKVAEDRAVGFPVDCDVVGGPAEGAEGRGELGDGWGLDL